MCADGGSSGTNFFTCTAKQMAFSKAQERSTPRGGKECRRLYPEAKRRWNACDNGDNTSKGKEDCKYVRHRVDSVQGHQGLGHSFYETVWVQPLELDVCGAKPTPRLRGEASYIPAICCQEATGKGVETGPDR